MRPDDLDLLFAGAREILTSGTDPPPIMAFRLDGEATLQYAVILDEEAFAHRHDVLKTVIAQLQPVELCLCYDGYMTMFSPDPCSVCLGEEEKESCDHCRGLGSEPTTLGRREAICLIELTTGDPIMHAQPYTRAVNGTILFDARETVNAAHVESEYPSLCPSPSPPSSTTT
jgi:hypothetical protein